jgi:hypothetical protein
LSIIDKGLKKYTLSVLGAASLLAASCATSPPEPGKAKAPLQKEGDITLYQPMYWCRDDFFTVQPDEVHEECRPAMLEIKGLTQQNVNAIYACLNQRGLALECYQKLPGTYAPIEEMPNNWDPLTIR